MLTKRECQDDLPTSGKVVDSITFDTETVLPDVLQVLRWGSNEKEHKREKVIQ